MRKRDKRQREVERVASSFERCGDPAFAQRWRDIHSDAGVYLRSLAKTKGRVHDYLEWVSIIRERLEREGRWEQTDEWRIGTPGTDRLERIGAGFRATTEYHGSFSAEFETLPEAFEALAVMAKIQMDLFWTVGWSSWAGKSRLNVTDPEPKQLDDPDEHPYLTRLSREARQDGKTLAAEVEEQLASERRWTDELHIRELRVLREALPAVRTRWDDDEVDVIEFSVRNRSMRMAAEAPTVERALEFIEIFSRVQPDIQLILEWQWR